MTENELMTYFMEITGASSEVVASYYLASAKTTVLNRLYPFDNTIDTLPDKYLQTQLDIAIYLFNKAGAEGETQHNENGIYRTYESGGVPSSMLAGILPYCKVPDTDDDDEEDE